MVMIQGATRSKHASPKAAFASELGMKCHILLKDRTGSKDPNHKSNGNVLLDHLHGATTEECAGRRDTNAEFEAAAGPFRKEGKEVYTILGGGSNATGAPGYENCAFAPLGHANDRGLVIDHLVSATGSAGTQADLIVGLRAINAGIPLLGVGVRAPEPKQEESVYGLTVGAADRPGCPGVVRRDDVAVDCGCVGEADGIPHQARIAAIRMFAELEGILLDPACSGKGATALVGHCSVLAGVEKQMAAE